MVLKGGRSLLTVVLLCALPRSATPCSCVRVEPFLRFQARMPVVLVGAIVRYGGDSRGGTPLWMELDVHAVWKGKEARRRVRIWGDNGFECRPYVTQFAVGSAWILALHTGTTGVPKDDYVITNCGESWLPVIDYRARGIIQGDVLEGGATLELPLSELRLQLLR
jgi:hypothetical protein